MIRNIDRRTERANMFVHNKEFYVIDHELTLNVKTDCTFYLGAENIEKWHFLIKKDVGKKGEHIFYKKLKEINAEQNLVFDDFIEYLRNLSPQRLLGGSRKAIRKT